MPYGVKRGIKAPGEFGMGDIMSFGLAGAAGIVAALVTDYQQQGEASALFTINKWVVEIGSLLGFTDIPLWMVIIGLTALGAGSIFYFQPITRQGAFAQGFGLLAVMMTAVPPDLAVGIEAMNENLAGLQPVVAREAALRTKSSQTSSLTADIELTPVQEEGPDKYEVNLTINFPNGFPADVETMIRRGSLRGRLHNEDTGETWSIVRSSGGAIRREENALVIQAGVPARSETARLWVRIECSGYAIEEQSAMANLDQTLVWTVEMKPSNMPLFIQRLGKSYWF